MKPVSLSPEKLAEIQAKVDSEARARHEADEFANEELLKKIDSGSCSVEDLNRHAKEMTGTRLIALVLAIYEHGLQRQWDVQIATVWNLVEKHNTKARAKRREIALLGKQANEAAKEKRKREARAVYAGPNPETGKPWKRKEDCIMYLMQKKGWSRAAINTYLPAKTQKRDL